MSQEDKVKYADYVIDNSGRLEELRKKAFAFIVYEGEVLWIRKIFLFYLLL